MASSSGTSSGPRNSSSEEDVQQRMDRKRKRMISNRESARRSRQRKQKHLDDLVAQLSQIKRENNEIQTRMNVTTHLYFNIEAENSILRAQVVELSHRLASLNDIIDNANANLSNSLMEAAAGQDSATPQSDYSSNNDDYQIGDDFFMNPWSSFQPIMDMVMY